MDVMALGQEALQLALVLAAPLLIAIFATGLLVSMLQAATQIQEMTLSFVPKLLVLFGVLVLSGTWIVDRLVEFTREILLAIPNLAG